MALLDQLGDATQKMAALMARTISKSSEEDNALKQKIWVPCMHCA